MNEKTVIIPMSEYKSLVKTESKLNTVIRFIKLKSEGSCLLKEDIFFLLDLIASGSEEEL